MSNDITKPNAHIYWLWLAVAALAGMTLKGYLSLRADGDCLYSKITGSEMTIKIQLAEIKTSLLGVEATLIELKRDIKRRNEP